MTKLFITLLSVFFALQSTAQKTITVNGSAKTEEGKPLPKASVKLHYIGLKDTLRTTTNEKGVYTFQNVLTRKAIITISYIGYKKFSDAYDYSNATVEELNNEVIMTVGDNLLETVTIESSKIQIKEDTVSYKIDSTMFRKNDNVEEVLKKLPGVEVDKDGNVKAQGKDVTKVKVNGKEFFGGDVKTATRQLNADMVDKIQIIDDYGDQSAFTGVKDGDPTKTLNIQLKKDKNKGIFGNGTVGAGTQERYLGSLNLNKFNNNQQISFNGNINNINASPFDFSRIPGAMRSIAGSMMRSFGGAGAANFGNNDGIGVTKSFGINYRDDWSPKISVNGSYSFSEKVNTVIEDIYQEIPSTKPDSTIFIKRANNDFSITDNHRFSFNVEYKIDSFNYIKFNPGFTLKKVRDNYTSSFGTTNPKGGLLNNGFDSTYNKSSTPNYNGSLLYNHRFHKKGRTLSLNLTAGNSVSTSDDDIYNNGTNANSPFPFSINQNVNQENTSYNYGFSASFNEQLTKKRGLEFNYAYNKRFVGNDRETYNVVGGQRILRASQTTDFENIYTTNRFGVNYRITQKKYNYSVGLGVQPATIENNSFTGSKLKFKQNLINYFPTVRFAYNFSKSKSFNLNYNGVTNQPTAQQLQPVVDSSNIQNIVYGNPDLRPEFSNTFSMRFNNFNFISGNVFFSNISVSFTNDKIVSDINIKPGGRQETRFINTNGFYNINAFYAISKPVQNRKYVYNYNGVINYNNNISFFNTQKNAGRNWILTQRISMDYKLKKWLETSAGGSFTLNDVKNSLNTNSNNNIRIWGLTHSSRLFFKYDFIFSYDVEKTINSGFTSNVSANPLLVNATLEKQLFKNKNASIKLQALDLLNENTNVARSVTGVAITDTRTNRLQRYFMLSFVYRFNKFKGAASGGPGFGGAPAGPSGGMRMGGPGF